MSPEILAVIVSVGVFTGLFFIMLAFNKKGSVSDRLKKISSNRTSSTQSDLELDEDTAEIVDKYTGFEELEGKKSGFAKTLEALFRGLGINVSAQEAELNLKFAQAGIHSPNATMYYLFIKRFGIILVLPLVLLFLNVPASGIFKGFIVFMAGIIFLAGIFGADLYLKNRKTKRQQILMKSFPDGLDLILVCVEAGLALDAALSRVCRELEIAHKELTKEFNRTRIELALLNDRPRALQNLAERTDLMAFRSLVGALLQSEKFGTSLTETLRVLSEDYRNTRLMKAEEKAGKLPALMTIPLILLIMPAFMMVVMSPAVMQVMKTWPK